MQTIDGVTLETRAEVGLLTRNVVVRGSVQEEWVEEIEACLEEFDTSNVYLEDLTITVETLANHEGKFEE